MKGDKKILVIAVLLLLISVGFATYAIYKSSTSVSGTAKLAGWHVEVDEEDFTLSPQTTQLTFTIADADCTTHNGYNGTIAPGDECTITVPIDATGSEVNVALTASLGTVTGLPTGMTVTMDQSYESQLIEYNATDMSTDIVINIEWATEDSSARNALDVAAQGGNVTIPITLTATQAPKN